METITIRRVNSETDAAEIARIYNRYILESTISFETTPLSEAEMSGRIESLSATYPYFVAVTRTGNIAGYCYVHQWKERAAYSHTVEASVYLADGFKHCGLGTRLTRRLIEACREARFHVIIACITGDNLLSIAMVEKLGFEKVSHFKAVGRKFGRYLDVVDYQLILSPIL